MGAVAVVATLVLGILLASTTLSDADPCGSPARAAQIGPQGSASPGVAALTSGLVLPHVGNTSVTTSTWPGYAGGGNLSGEAGSVGPTTNASLWQTYAGAVPSLPSGSPAASSAVVSEGLVYVTTGAAGGVLALNESTGLLAWSTTLPDHVTLYGGLLVADHIVFVPAAAASVDRAGTLFALNATTGAVLWGTPSGVAGDFETTPNLVDGTVILPDNQGYVYGWNESGNLTYSSYLGQQVDQPITAVELGPQRALALAVSGAEVLPYNALTGGAYPGIGWSSFALPQTINGSASETPFSWTARNGTRFSLDLAVVADDGGRERTSEVQVLSLLPSGLPSSGSGPSVASWTTPGDGEGFVGAPALLGEHGSNLTFALSDANGTLAVFSFSFNASGVGMLAPADFLPLGAGANATGAPVASGAQGGVLYVGTSKGSIEALSISSRTTLWTYQGHAPIATSPAVASGRLFVTEENGTLHALGGGSTPPGATRLLLTPSPLPWVEGGARANLTVDVQVWYTNGSVAPASGGLVEVSTHQGNVSGSPATLSSQGTVVVTYGAPTVSREMNATLFVNASWRSISNRTTVITVIVPPKLVNTTPLWVVPSPPPPTSLVAGEAVPINLTVTVGSGGVPLAGGLVTFQAFGGQVTSPSTTLNASGGIFAVFTAGPSTAAGSVSGFTMTVEKAGYLLGSYSWVTLVNAPPALVVGFEPGSLLVVEDSSETFEVLVNSTQGHAVAGAVLDLLLAAPEGSLSTSGGITGEDGVLEATYRAPISVPAPGVSTEIEVVASASGYTTWSGAIALTLVPNATGAPAGATPGSSWGDPLSGVSPSVAWALLGVIAVLALAVLLLLGRRPSLSRPSASVWESGEEGPEVTGRRGGAGPRGGPAAEDPASSSGPSRSEAAAGQARPDRPAGNEAPSTEEP